MNEQIQSMYQGSARCPERDFALLSLATYIVEFSVVNVNFATTQILPH